MQLVHRRLAPVTKPDSCQLEVVLPAADGRDGLERWECFNGQEAPWKLLEYVEAISILCRNI